MDSPYAPPTSEVGPPKTHSLAQWALWGCFGAIVLFALVFGSCIFAANGAMKLGRNEFEPICIQYLNKLESKDFSGAYALLGNDGKSVVSEEKHNALMSGIVEKLGAIKSKDIQGVQTGIDPKGRWGRIVYKVDFQNGSGTIKFELRKPTNDFQIIGVFFDSPVLSDFINNALSKKP